MRFNARVSLLLWTFLFSISNITVAQTVVTGVVKDAKSGEHLPGASIQIEGTYSGTITNSSGHFSVSIPDSSVVLVARYIGYQSGRLRIGRASELEVEFLLLPTTVALPEIVISGEDPAIRIMRRVIEEKKLWRAKLNTYVVNAYNRFRMENDTGIVSIWESGTRAYWDRERGTREVSLFQQQTQNMKMSDLLPAAMFILNLYDDDIEVAGHTLMGVTHPDAIAFYRFSLQEIRARDESEVYVISVKPRSKTSAGFVGTIFVLDNDFAMISAELRPGKAFLFPPPIQYVHIKYRQQFSSFNSDVWLPVDFQSEMDVKVGLSGILVFPEFKIRQLSRLSDFEINVSLPDSLYESDDRIVVDSTARSVKVLPVEIVGVPLTKDERLAYDTIDSTMTMEKAYKPSGIMARFVDMRSGDDNGADTSVSASVGFMRSVSALNLHLRPNGWYNRVEGFHARINATFTPVRGLAGLGMFGYSTETSDPGYGGGLRAGNRYSLQFWYADEVLKRYDSDIRSTYLNSGSTVLGGTDYFDYYRKDGWSVTATANRFLHRRLSMSVSYSNENHRSETQGVSDSFLGAPIPATRNAPVSEGSLKYVRIEGDVDAENLSIPIGPQKLFRFSLERSVGGSIVSSGNYIRAEGSLLWRFQTFFKRRLMPNALDIRLAAGHIRGNAVPVQKLGIVDGSSILTTFGTIKTLRDRPYEGDRWALLAWDHTFRTVPFELMGWNWAVRRHWNVIVHGAHGATSIQSSTYAVATSKGVHHELGISLSGLFTAGRLDAAWRLDEPGFRLSFSIARIF